MNGRRKTTSLAATSALGNRGGKSHVRRGLGGWGCLWLVRRQGVECKGGGQVDLSKLAPPKKTTPLIAPADNTFHALGQQAHRRVDIMK